MYPGLLPDLPIFACDDKIRIAQLTKCSSQSKTGIGGFLGAQAERDQFLYYTRTTQERVERSCVGEMEREVHEILARSGVDSVGFLFSSIWCTADNTDEINEIASIGVGDRITLQSSGG